jgi:hypothetical protein
MVKVALLTASALLALLTAAPAAPQWTAEGAVHVGDELMFGEFWPVCMDRDAAIAMQAYWRSGKGLPGPTDVFVRNTNGCVWLQPEFKVTVKQVDDSYGPGGPLLICVRPQNWDWATALRKGPIPKSDWHTCAWTHVRPAAEPPPILPPGNPPILPPVKRPAPPATQPAYEE